MEHIIRASSDDPMRATTNKADTANPVDYGKRRIGGPKQQWTYQTNKHAYEKLFVCEGALIYQQIKTIFFTAWQFIKSVL